MCLCIVFALEVLLFEVLGELIKISGITTHNLGTQGRQLTRSSAYPRWSGISLLVLLDQALSIFTILGINLWQLALVIFWVGPQVLNILLRRLPQIFQIKVSLLVLLILDSLILDIELLDPLLSKPLLSILLHLLVL